VKKRKLIILYLFSVLFILASVLFILIVPSRQLSNQDSGIEKVDALIQKGAEYYHRSQYSEALRYFQQALEISRKTGDSAGEGQTLNNMGVVYRNLGQYSRALEYFWQSLEISRKTGDDATEGRTLGNIGNIYYQLGQYSKALEYYEQSLGISRKTGDVAGEALSLTNIVNVYNNLSQYSKALEYLEQSLNISRKTGDSADEGKTLNNMGVVYRNLGQYSKALEYLEQSLEIRRKTGDVAGEGHTLDNIGNIYNNLGRYSKALEYHEQSLGISRKTGDVAGEGHALTNIGNVYIKLSQYSKALEYYEQSLGISRKTGNVAGEGLTLNNMGAVYNSLGQYSKTLEYYEQSLGISRKTGNVAGEGLTLNNIGNIYSQLGQYSKALEYYEQSLGISRKTGNVAGEGLTLGSIGNIYSQLGQYSKALEYYEQSLEISRKTGNVAGEAISLTNIGNVYNNLSQYSKALEYYEQSLGITRRIGDVPGEGFILTNLGLVYHALGNYEEAVERFRASVGISDQLGVLEMSWRSWRGLAETLWRSGKPEEAVAPYQHAIEAIEKLYGQTTGLKEEERSSMIGEKASVYEEFIDLLLELHRKHPEKGYDGQAFVISGKAKSRVFQELMAKAGARAVFSGDDTFTKMIAEEQQLIGEITTYHQNLTKEYSKPENQRNEEVVTSLKEQLSKIEKSLGDLEKEIDEKYPRYADLKRPKALTVEELQEILKADETVLSYAVTQDKTVAFVIGKKSFHLTEIETGKEELAGLIKKFRKGIDKVYGLKDLERFKPEVAYELYQKIFGPVAPELKGKSKIYISADDILFTLPFEALIDKEIDVEAFREARKKGRKGQADYLGEYSTLHYLVESYTITYLPSASVLRSLRKYEKPGYGEWDRTLIAFADPVFSKEEAEDQKGAIKGKGIKSRGVSKETELTFQILSRSTGGNRLKRLKESSQEAKAISLEINGKESDIYLRNNATEQNIYNADMKDAQYLLFSTHGLLGGDFSGVAEPSLALTLIDNPPGRDGFLAMSEVLGLDLNAEMIILSACNTYGQGEKAGSGEGFAGLTRSFMYAGSKALLVTHWSVESRAARDLMVNTFKEMKKKNRPDALREAKLNMMDSSRPLNENSNIGLSLSHPFFWAPFVLVGEGQ
jgi:tetratricopeptide (TPR) repeat protein/CHAT domain-containing protein